MPFRSKNSFAKTHPHLTEFTDFLVLFNKESDRGGVLIATSMLDNLLEKIISSLHTWLIHRNPRSSSKVLMLRSARYLPGYCAPMPSACFRRRSIENVNNCGKFE